MMRKRFLLLFTIALLMLPFIFGCRKTPDDLDDVCLWIVTEGAGNPTTTAAARQNELQSLQKWVTARFEEKHPGVTVRLEALPADAQERADRLEQLRTQIMAGEGPDGYLMPDQAAGGQETLFYDASLAMDNGLFADLSAYYDGDTALDTQALRQDIMDAGVLDGKRYLLPMRYNFQVIYADAAQLKAAGLDPARLGANLYSFYDAVVESGRGDWKQLGLAAFWRGWALLPPAFDYEAREVVLSPEDMETFFRRFQMAAAQDEPAAGAAPVDLWGYWREGKTIAKDSPLSVQRLNEILPLVAIAKNEGTDLTMLPLAGIDGKTAAEVTYYGAASAHSAHPDLVYALLREFLTEEAQWEGDRAEKCSSLVLSSAGFPVRSRGAVAPLWERYRQLLRSEAATQRSTTARQRALLDLSLTDEEIPLLTTPVDRVYFGNAELETSLGWQLNQLCESGADSEEAASAAVEALFADLERHLAEG